METKVLEYIQQPLPSDMRVVSQSIPVLFFGNIETATIATFGINPSKREFLDKNDALLPVSEKRFIDRSILGVSDNEMLTTEDARKVYKSLLEYFDDSKHPYGKWFNVLDSIFKGFKFSYYSGSLIHLDIYPWATNPTWNSLFANERKKMIENGKKCLDIVLESSKISAIYINGRSAMNHFEDNICKMKSIENFQVERLSYELKQGNYKGKRIIGWSTNLQSSYGVSTEFILSLEGKVKKIIGDLPTSI